MAEQLEKIDSLESLLAYMRNNGWRVDYSDEHLCRTVPINWVLEGSHTLLDNESLAGIIRGDYGRYAPEDAPEGWLDPAGYLNAHNFWVFRELNRHYRSLYYKPSFASYLRNSGCARYWWHFPHISLDDRSMIAFTPSHEYGVRDRQVRMKAGKYLTKYYSDLFDAETIRRLANEAKPFELSFAATADEMVEVYRDGPDSCMSGDFDVEGHHPVEVYATGEFRLAYIKSGGRIVARGFVHDPSLTWVRCYGEEMLSLQGMLNAAGFKKAYSWCGAHLKLIQLDRGYLLPYIDGDQNVERVRVGDKWMWEVTSDSTGVSGSQTNGYACAEDEDDYFVCDECGERYHNDDANYIEREGITVCDGCRDEEFVEAIVRTSGWGRRGYVRYDNAIEIRGEWYLNDPELLSACGFVVCAWSEEWVQEGDAVTTVDDTVVCADYTFWWTEDNETKFQNMGELPSDFAGAAGWVVQIVDDAVVGVVPPEQEIDDLDDLFPTQSAVLRPLRWLLSQPTLLAMPFAWEVRSKLVAIHEARLLALQPRPVEPVEPAVPIEQAA